MEFLLTNLGIGERVAVQTRNTRYTLTAEEDGRFSIEGSAKYCLSPCLIDYIGSTANNGVSVRLGRITPGQQMFWIDGTKDKVIITSTVVRVEALGGTAE